MRIFEGIDQDRASPGKAASGQLGAVGDRASVFGVRRPASCGYMAGQNIGVSHYVARAAARLVAADLGATGLVIRCPAR